jgi:O-antigen/teichoic acid export membrane protein
VIIALGMLLATASGPVDVMLLMAGRSALSLANNSAALAVNLVLNLLLIPQYGIVGAAVAGVAALVTRNLLPLIQVRRLLGMSPTSGGLLWACGAAALSFAALPLLARIGLGTGVAAALTGLALGATVYLALLWLGRSPLALTAFTALLPGRTSRESAEPAIEAPPRSVHVPDA